MNTEDITPATSSAPATPATSSAEAQSANVETAASAVASSAPVGTGAPGVPGVGTATAWYVLRDLTRPNAKLPGYKLAEREDLEVFTPMRWTVRRQGGKMVKTQVPVIHDLLFVHATRERLDRVIETTATLQYRFVRGAGYRQPMTVNAVDMDRFMQAVGATDMPRYYTPAELTELSLGRSIRLVCDGVLNGYEGRLISIRGGRRKRLLVSLPGLLAVEYDVMPDYIQFLD